MFVLNFHFLHFKVTYWFFPSSDELLSLISVKMAEDGIDLVKEVLNEVQLSQFFLPIRDDLQITKLEHFEFVKPEDFDPVGLSRPGTVYLLCA